MKWPVSFNILSCLIYLMKLAKCEQYFYCLIYWPARISAMDTPLGIKAVMICTKVSTYINVNLHKIFYFDLYQIENIIVVGYVEFKEHLCKVYFILT